MEFWQNLRNIEDAVLDAFDKVNIIKIKRLPGHKFYQLDQAPPNAELVRQNKKTDDGSHYFSDSDKR